MEHIPLFALIVLTQLLAAVSLFYKAESIRGSGRVVSGISILAMSYFAYLQIETGSGLALGLVIALAACGLVTIASGARKFARRNLEQA